MSYINISHLKGGFTGEIVWASMSSVFLYLLALICVVTGVYVGREFHRKTICYEVMSGYSFGRIALSKTVTCGILVSAILLVCMLVYLAVFPAAFCDDFFLRVLLIFVLFIHLSSCSVLYVLLCRNGAVGGSLAFVRFIGLETLAQTAAGRFLPAYAQERIMRLSVFDQWYELIDVGTALSKECMICVLAAAVVEYGVLMGVLGRKREIG
ncbi:MAG: hypothetical protein NC086_09560 [Alistipes sp.]|nr:hypothetical protein [Alistipes sp.]